MRKLLIVAAYGAWLISQAHAQSTVVLDNARVRVVQPTGASIPEMDHRPGVIVRLDTGEASWADDVTRSAESLALQAQSSTPSEAARDFGRGIVIVEPKDAATAPPPPSATQPGGAQFTGMSFKPIFENDKVRVIRARMELDAREGFHTHGSDTIVVHLSGGEIEDTANGKTVVNKWKPGDVEYEARGSSHSARNIGKPVDVVLVALK